MANNRTVFVGNVPTDDLFQVTDETFNAKTGGSTVLNFTGTTILVEYIGKAFEFSGPGYPIWPAQADPNKTNFWNVGYTFAADDCSKADIYSVFITVTDAAGHSDTYAVDGTLTVSALPVPS